MCACAAVLCTAQRPSILIRQVPLAAMLRLSCLCRNQPQAANEALAKAQADKAALAEECAALKGRVTALEEQLAAVAATSSTTEQMRAR